MFQNMVLIRGFPTWWSGGRGPLIPKKRVSEAKETIVLFQTKKNISINDDSVYLSPVNQSVMQIAVNISDE